MRNYLFALAILVLSGSAQAGNFSNDVCSVDNSLSRGDDNYWPWGKETSFPWLAIQGIWAPTENNDCGSYFIFKTRPNHGENKVIQIVQYDPRTCQKIAWGAGIESDRVVRAAMIDKVGHSFDLTVRAFDQTQVAGFAVNGSGQTGISTQIIVVSMYPKGDWDLRKSYEMKRINETPALLCITKNQSF